MSDRNFKNKIYEVNKILTEINADKIPQILVKNKIDINDFDQNEVINPVNSVSVSAKEGIGIEMLRDLVSNHANRGLFKGKLLINFNSSKVRSECYRKAKIINDEETNDGWVLTLTIGNYDLKDILSHQGIEIIDSNSYFEKEI